MLRGEVLQNKETKFFFEKLLRHLSEWEIIIFKLLRDRCVLFARDLVVFKGPVNHSSIKRTKLDLNNKYWKKNEKTAEYHHLYYLVLLK